MKKVILFTLLSLFCVSSQGQDKTGDKRAIVYYEYKVFGGFHRPYVTADGRMLRHGSKICISLIRGEWCIHGYLGEKEDTVRVSEKEALKVDKMIRKIRWEYLHPEPVEGLLKAECDDCSQWSVYACTFRGECHEETDIEMSGYIEPKKVAKRYRAVKRGIHKINKYLQGFLSIF